MIATIIKAATHSMLCHVQKLLKPCPWRSSSVWALMLGPMMTARKLEKQQGPDSHGRDIDQMGAEDGPHKKLQQRKAKQKGTGFWATPQGRRLTPCREGEPVQNRSQTWQDRDGVWHNWRTSERTRTRNAQQTWNQTGQDWQRDRPSTSQEWRHDWQWEGDRDRTPKNLFCIEYSLWEPAGGLDDESWGPGSGTKGMQAVRLLSVAQAQPNQGSLLPWTPAPGRLPRQESGPPQPKRKVVEKWSLFEALKKKLHQAN